MQTIPKTSDLRIAFKRFPASEYAIEHPMANPLTHLAIHTMDGIHLIPMDQIDRVEAAGNYCTVYHTAGSRLITSKTLRTVEEALPKNQFFRIHQTHLVRISSIQFVSREEVELTDGTRLSLSRHQRPLLITLLKDFAVKI